MTQPASTSPCIRNCTLARGPGAIDYCIGCLRTVSEIVEWGGASPVRQQSILSALPARKDWLSHRD